MPSFYLLYSSFVSLWIIFINLLSLISLLSHFYFIFSVCFSVDFFVLFLFALPTHLYPSVSEMIQFSQMTLVSSDTGVFSLLVCSIIPLFTQSQRYPTLRDIKVTKSGLEVGLESTVSGTTVQILFRHLCFSLFLLTCQMG